MKLIPVLPIIALSASIHESSARAVRNGGGDKEMIQNDEMRGERNLSFVASNAEPLPGWAIECIVACSYSANYDQERSEWCVSQLCEKVSEWCTKLPESSL